MRSEGRSAGREPLGAPAPLAPDPAKRGAPSQARYRKPAHSGEAWRRIELLSMGTCVRDHPTPRTRSLSPSDRAKGTVAGRGRRRELPDLPLEDALQLVHLYFERGSPKAEPAARRWLVRYLSEGTPSLRESRRSRRVLLSTRSRRAGGTRRRIQRAARQRRKASCRKLDPAATYLSARPGPDYLTQAGESPKVTASLAARVASSSVRTESCMRSTASAARSLAWSTSPSGAVDPNTVYVITPLFSTSSTTSHVPGKRPWILTPGSGTAWTHRISDESGVINTMQTFGSGDTAYGILSSATRNVFDSAEP